MKTLNVSLVQHYLEKRNGIICDLNQLEIMNKGSFFTFSLNDIVSEKIDDQLLKVLAEALTYYKREELREIDKQLTKYGIEIKE